MAVLQGIQFEQGKRIETSTDGRLVVSATGVVSVDQTKPEVPAVGVVAVQDVVDALISLNLVTQAAGE